MANPLAKIRSYRTQITAVFILLACFAAAAGNLLIYEYALKANLEQLRSKLQVIAGTVAFSIDADTLLKIPLERDGTNTEPYRQIEAKLLRVKETAPSLAYIYILTKTGNNNILKFVMDIHPGYYKASLPPALPGEEYDTSKAPELMKGFSAPSADKDIVADRWGAFLSGYAPIRNSEGAAVAVLGIDITADDVYKTEAAVRKRIIFVFLISVLLSVVAGMLIAGEVVSPVKKLVEATRRIAGGDLRYKVEIKGPNELEELAGSFNRMGTSLLKAREELLSYFYRAVQSLIRILEARDPSTKGHSDRVADYSSKIAAKMGLSKEKAQLLRDAALLHDIGKLGIHDIVLNKRDPLTTEDWHAIRKHPEIGAEILKPVSINKELLAVVREHHERYDGKGYPEGLKGDEIDKLAAIVAVADSYDAMTSHREYKKELTKAEAMEQLKTNSGTQFDPEVVDAFIKVLEEG